MGVSFRRYEEYLDEVLQDPARAVGYLNACLEEYDPAAFRLALRDVARARGGIERLGETSSCLREQLDRLFSETDQVDLESLEALLDALGFRLSITLKDAS